MKTRKASEKLRPIDAEIERALAFSKSVDQERRREERRQSVATCIGIILACVGFWGWFFVCLGPLDLVFIRLGLGRWLSIGSILCFGLPLLFCITCLWISEKTGLHYLIQDWVVSWDTWDSIEISDAHKHKYKHFPRRKRKIVVKEFKKKLDVIGNQISRLNEQVEQAERELYDNDDEVDDPNFLSESLDNFNHVISELR